MYFVLQKKNRKEMRMMRDMRLNVEECFYVCLFLFLEILKC